MDLAWAITRMCPTKLFTIELAIDPSLQSIPSWSAFNSLVVHAHPCLTEIGYCPMIAGSPTEFSVMYTVMKHAQSMMKLLGQTDTVITFDLAIYVKAKELQWRNHEEFRDTVIRLGGFHIALNFLSVIGKHFQDSGIEDLLIESGTYGPNTASSLLHGKTFNRGVRGHKLLMEAMLRLQWKAFTEWHANQFEDEGDLSDMDVDAISRAISQCRENTSTGESPSEPFQDVCEGLQKVDRLFKAFKSEGEAQSNLFALWNSYITMVSVLLDFIRAERTADWLGHLSATAAMTPYFFAMDRSNYARWLPVYLTDMRKLPDTHARVHEEFIRGNHPVSHSAKPFSEVWTDMALEQSINLDSKKQGGITGITHKPGALERWFLTSHQRAAITSATKAMCGLKQNDDTGTHKESGQQRMKRDEADVQNLVSAFSSELMTNPFDLSKHTAGEVLPLLNIATGVVVPSELTHQLIHAVELGRNQMEEFIDQRLKANTRSFWDPIPQLKLKTFASLSQKKKLKTRKEKTQVVSADRNLFGRLIIAAKSRDVDLKDVLSYELSSVPFSLAHADGSLRSNKKSVLLDVLQGGTECCSRLPKSEPPLLTAIIVDAMSVIHMVKVHGLTTFGDLADKYWDVITGVALQQRECMRIDIVFDRYDVKESIKEQTRLKRGATTLLEVRIAGDKTPVPSQWSKFLNNPVNKANLTNFLCERWNQTCTAILPIGKTVVLAGGFRDPLRVCKLTKGHSEPLDELQSDHEEADTRMILHALHASHDHDRVVVHSPDTDVAVLSVYSFSSMQCTEMWFRTGTKDKLRYLPIHTIANRIGPAMCRALPGFHSLTGCDSTSALSGIGKKKGFELLKTSGEYQDTASQLGENLTLSERCQTSSEKLVCALYTKDARPTADGTRYFLFCQKQKQNENLPPTSNSLRHHIQRANFQAFVWKKCLSPFQNLPSPCGHGWQLVSGVLQPLLMSKEPAPTAILELISCKCKASGCKRSDLCQCKANSLVCTEACLCMAGESCGNIQASVDSDDSDSEG